MVRSEVQAQIHDAVKISCTKYITDDRIKYIVEDDLHTIIRNVIISESNRPTDICSHSHIRNEVSKYIKSTVDETINELLSGIRYSDLNNLIANNVVMKLTDEATEKLKILLTK